VDPIFGGAGIIVPPVRPGWANAQVQVIMPEATGLAERQAAAFGGMTTTEAETLVAQILSSVGQENYVITDARQYLARDFTADQREKHAKKGNAMPNGSYPIVTQEDLNNAWGLRGRSKDYTSAQIEAHCRAMAKKHGLKMPGGE
jgi:hypothetical protein